MSPLQGTLPRVYWPLMELPSVRLRFCAWCGATWPLNQHHFVWRSWGNLYRDGRRLEKPTVTLCGSGNAGGCHGLAHSRQLHFRNNGGSMEALLTREPTRYVDALGMPGWRVPPGLLGEPGWEVRHA